MSDPLPEKSPGLSLDEPRAATLSETRRARTVWLANKRQELHTPVSALLELGDMLLHDAAARGNTALVQDLEKINASTRRLQKMVQEALDPARAGDLPEDLGRHVRHELRTPLTHIIGLCELWLEDADDPTLEGLIEDLKSMHGLGKQLNVSVDDLVHYQDLAQAPEVPLPADFVAPKVAGPRTEPQETGAILVVDDNAINCDLLRRRLTRDGHTVTVAPDGVQALDILKAQSFDLILLDILMPGLNGIEVLTRLKSDDRLRHIPVIMISALQELEDVVHCIEIGAEDYLAKPFNPTLLRARINACLEKKRLRDREVQYLQQIKKEQQRADELLHVILPGEIVRELKDTNTVQPRRYENVAVMFCDIVGFTPFCDRNQPEKVVPYLQKLIEAWEEIADRHHVEKIKTIGDAFMAAAGLLLKTRDNPVRQCVECGLEMIDACQRLPTGWDLRVGIHVGPVVGGVIGLRQYLFDLWGDTVNTAARMESHGIIGSIVLSGPAWDQIAHLARAESLGPVPVKGKGDMTMVRFVDWSN